MSTLAWLAFIAAAGVGAPLRYVVGRAVQRRTSGALPLGTLVVNVSGSFVLGVVSGLALYHGFPDEPKVVLGTGFCGAYTTFSTFSFDTINLLEAGNTAAALRNALGTTVACLLAAAAGLALSAW